MLGDMVHKDTVKNLLTFLREKIRKQGVSMKSIANALDISPSGLTHLFSYKNTLSLAQFIIICNTLGLVPGEVLLKNS